MFVNSVLQNSIKVKLDTGKIIKLSQNESLEKDWRCPKCGSQLITNYGDGISLTCCTNDKCDWNYYDYD